MTFTGVAPGQSSLRALEWLARVGASPSLPLQLVMGCSEPVARDHVSRLEAAGLVQRTPMRRGDGALVMVTRKGALEAGHPARRALRSLAPTGWAHAGACAWVSMADCAAATGPASARSSTTTSGASTCATKTTAERSAGDTAPISGRTPLAARSPSKSSYNQRPPPGCAGSAGWDSTR